MSSRKFHARLMVCGCSLIGCITNLGAASAAEQSAPQLSGKLGTPIALFNGKDLSDWVWYQRPAREGTDDPVSTKTADVWTVDKGVLRSKGLPKGYLRTKKDFKNFVLTVEERHVAEGNGGLLVGIKETDKIWPGLEIQTETGDAGDLWNHNLLRLKADAARVPAEEGGRRIVRFGPNSQKPVGEWDTLELTVDNGNVIYRVNGVLQNVVTETEDLSGKVGLQVEGAVMEFRKVMLTPIEGK